MNFAYDIEINSRRNAGLFGAVRQDSDSVIAARSAPALDFR